MLGVGPSGAVEAGLGEQQGSSGREITSILSREKKTDFSTVRNIRFPRHGKWEEKKGTKKTGE